MQLINNSIKINAIRLNKVASRLYPTTSALLSNSSLNRAAYTRLYSSIKQDNSSLPPHSTPPPQPKPESAKKDTVSLEELFKTMPGELQIPTHPAPIRNVFYRGLNSEELENLDINLKSHRVPVTISDKIALRVVRLLRLPTDWFFKKKYVHRAVMLETVAAVPGMVGGTIRHLQSLRLMKHDGGWIHHLLHEAENERMHLMTWMRVSQPKLWERGLITVVQGVFYNAFFLLYLLSPTTAHRVVGYLEEEAVISYTSFLNEIDNGNIENSPAPQIAIDYWHLENDATLRDVVLAIRADEALHRDTNHHFADRLIIKQTDLRAPVDREIKENAKIKEPEPVAQDRWSHPKNEVTSQ